MIYFSEIEEGEPPRVGEDLTNGTWGGIRALVSARIDDGSFGVSYPDSCPEGKGPIGTDASALWQAMQADIPNFQKLELPIWYPYMEMPRTLDALDMIQFCWRSVARPLQFKGGFHEYYGHHHLRFDVEAGRKNFREDLNRILRRNSLAFELQEDGSIRRLVPPMLQEAIASAYFCTRDLEFNRILETACTKLLSPDIEARREALEKLWAGWERLKTLGTGPDKKARISALLDSTAGSSSPILRDALEKEANEITRLGNTMQIRHSEMGKEKVLKTESVDYLFHRLLSLIQVIVRTNSGL